MIGQDGENQRRKVPERIDVPEGQVRILESLHAMDFEMDLSTWPFHKICWVAVGKGHLEASERSNSIQVNDFLLLPAGLPHRFVDDAKEPLSLVVLCISEKFLSERSNRHLLALWNTALEQNALGKPFCARTAFHRSNLIDSFRLALREQRSQYPGWETLLETVASRVIVSFSRNNCEPSEAHVDSSMRSVEGAIEYIDTHVHERLQLEQMAARSHLSPRRFTTLFKKRTGSTFSEYLNRKRIEYACQRLEQTGHILYACHGSGFNDVAYYYRVFKKFTGMTPGEYLQGAK